jgi:DNA polymerase-1
VYLTPTSSHWACDIEADNLLDEATRIWCVCVCNLVTKEERSFTDASSFLSWLSDEFILVGHNFIAYDLVMLNRFWNAKLGISRVVDTYVLSQLYNPTYAGGHSLESWGKRLRYEKSKHSDFSCYSSDMLTYCRRDTRLVGLLFTRLSERMRQVGFTEHGAEIEHLAWNIIQNKQKKNGFPFDKQKAEALYATLRAREEELKAEIYKLWPPELRVVGEYKRPYKADGSRSLQYQRHLEQYPKVEETAGGAGYRVYDYVSFSLGSPKQRIEKLLSLGWEPINRTEKGNPKVDEDELLAFAETAGKPEVAALAKWIVINSRANMVRTWLDSVNPETGCIHGRLFIASTLRYRHSNPNSANIPAVRVDKEDNVKYGEDGSFTYEARDCWTAGSDPAYVLVGIDGTGIQNRCLIHHLICTVGEEAVKDFKELALRGDVHKRNIEVLGLANKAAAKKFYYTLMMGGGGSRLAADQAQFGTKMSARQGSILKNKMIASIPGFGELIAKLEKELEDTGRIRLCDGTPILVPSPHMVIPYLLQGDESRLMKQAMIYLEQEIRREQLRAFKVADIHDEWQYRVHREDVQRFERASREVFPRAGEAFGYKIEINGDSKVGLTWAETH